MCLCVRDRERRWGERRDTAASDRRCGNVRGKEKMRSVREEFSRRESAEMTWMMDESSTLLHRRKEKSVCCVCVRARQRADTHEIALYSFGAPRTHSRKCAAGRMKRRGR